MKKLLLWAAAAFLCFVVVGFLLVPWLIKRQVTSRARTQLHRDATVAKVRFNPFTLEARLVGFDLRDDDGTPLLAYDTMVVNFSVMSVVHRAISLDEFRLVRPAAVARIDQKGELAVADLLGPDSAGAPKDTAPPRPPRLEIRLLSIVDGKISYVDESRAPRYEEEFNQLSLRVDGLSTLPNEKGDHVLTVNFASGAQLKWTGKNVFDPIDLEGRVEITDARLTRLAEVFGAKYPLVVTSGRAGATFSYAIAQDSGRGFIVKVPDASFNAVEVAARPRNVTEDWLRVPRIDIEGATLEWPARIARIEQLRATDPWLSAVMEKDGTLNWTPIADAFTVADSAAPPDSAPAWDLVLQQLDVTGGAARLADASRTPAVNYELSQFTLKVTPVSSDPASKAHIEASATLGKGATFSATGDAVREPFSADLDVAGKGLQLTLLKPYLGANPPATIKSGTASMSGKARLRKTRPTATFDGRASITKFALDDSTRDPLLAWQEMKVSGIRYTQAPDLLRIREVVLEQPFARVAISKDRNINLMSLTTMMPADTTTPPLKYEIGEVKINNARIDFSDESLILPFRTNIDSAHGTIRDIASFGGAPGALELEGKVEEYGLARASGVIYINDPYASTDIKADFRNLDMKSFTPYSAQFAGYSITDGRLDIDMEYHVKDRQLKADHHIVATNLKLGDKVEGGESPGFLVKLAISLLKDKDGRIKLDVPVEGTVDDPQFSYKAIAWKAVKQILGKIATAPFRFLGKVLGIGGGDEIDLVDFDPGRSDVIPPERQKLDSLAAEMGRKPELTLAVEGRYDSISDAQAIREQKLDARVKTSRDSLGKKAQSDTSTTMSARILESLYAADHGKPALDSLKEQFKLAAKADTAAKNRKYDPTSMYAEIRTQLLAAETAEPAELVTLASDRATAAVAILTAAGLDPARVTTAEPQPVSRKKSGSSRIPSELKMDAK
jgi:uncharacterized protein involved in outer membrane biogenesis